MSATAPDFFIERLGIVGVGLIGGSLARALKEAGAVGEVVGFGRDPAHLKKARELNVIDVAADSLARLASCDVIVLAVPVLSMHELLEALAPVLVRQTVVTDVGSVKGNVANAARKSLGARVSHFVPAHPIAGTERSGVEASFAELFRGRRVVLTPLPETDQAGVELVRGMWRATGAEVLDMSVARHDEVFALTSHLPHVLAYALVELLARRDGDLFQFAASGFRDFTRIASSDPFMWRDICLANRGPLLAAIEQYEDRLAALKDAVARADAVFLNEFFVRAKRARDVFGDKS